MSTMLRLLAVTALCAPASLLVHPADDQNPRADLPLDVRGSPPGTPVRPFTAAVYETAAVPWDADQPQPWRQNMDTARRQAWAASAQGVDILVLAEYGISGDGVDSTAAGRFAQRLPPLDAHSVPCDEQGDHLEVLSELSCMARDSRIYLVVNLMDRQQCDATEDQQACADKDEAFYNTNVVFDRNGTLIQFYRKVNLFDAEYIALTPGEPRLAAFRTDFGVTFGLMTCFDILFQVPSIELWKKGIDHFAFPTYWGDELPSLTALQMHPAWARGLDVTLLSANIHSVGTDGGLGQDVFTGIGSGIFTGNGVVNNTYNYRSQEGALITALLPGRSSYDAEAAIDTPHKDTLDTALCFNEQDDYYPIKNYNVSEFGSALITGKTETTCFQEFCCTLTMNQSADFQHSTGDGCSSALTPTFRLLAFSGHRNSGDPFAFEVCAVILCADSTLQSCSFFPGTTQQQLPPFQLTGTFSLTTYVFPSVVQQHMHAAADWEYARAEQTLTVSDTQQLMIAQLYGRNYAADDQE